MADSTGLGNGQTSGGLSMAGMPTQGNDRSIADLTMGVVAALLFIPITIVLVRLYIRCSVAKRFRSDDCFITIATTLAIANAVALVFHCRENMATDVLMMKSTWVFYMTSWPTLWAIKMNVLCQCSHIFAKLGSRHARHLIWAVMVLVTGSMIAAIGSTLFACVSISNLWTPMAKTTGCIDIPAMRFGNTAVSTFEDFVVLMLACLVVIRTELNLRNKVYLVGILKLGAIAFVASIARLVSEGLVLTRGANHHPKLWALLPIAAAFQVDLAIAAASLPSFAPLLPANRRAKAAQRHADVETSPRSGPRHGRKSFVDEKLEMVNKSIIVEREYSIKTEFSPVQSRAQSRRSSFSKALECGGGGETYSEAKVEKPVRAALSIAQVTAQFDKAVGATSTTRSLGSGGSMENLGQHEDDDVEKEIQNRVRAAQLLGLRDEENKYLSAVLPQRWSIWGAVEENRMSLQDKRISQQEKRDSQLGQQ